MRCVFIYVLPHRLARLLQAAAALYNDDARHILATMPPWRRRGERERERRLLLLGLTWNAITFDTPPAFEKTSHPALAAA